MISAQRTVLQGAMRRHAAASPFLGRAVGFVRKVPTMRAVPFSMLAAKQGTMTSTTARLLLFVPRGFVRSSTKAGVSPAQRTAAERRQEMVEKGKGHWSKLKDLWQKYGIVAVGTYFSMYGVVLGSIYVAIERGWVNTTKTSRGEGADEQSGQDFNLVTATNKVISLAEDLGIAKYLEVERVSPKTGSFLIAWIATKFTEPLRLAITLAITPRIARLVGRAPKIIKAPKA